MLSDRENQLKFLREQAKRLREIAAAHKKVASPELLKLAMTVENRIDRLEKDAEA